MENMPCPFKSIHSQFEYLL